MEKLMEQMSTWLVSSGPRIVGAILVLIVGRILAGAVRGFIRKILSRGNADPSLVNFIGNLSFALIIVFTLVAALAKFGVETASFVAVLGAASFAVGFALQGSLSNFAAGVMLLVFRPFRVGHYIEAAGIAGSVRSIGLFSTELATPDNVQITVPNGKLYGDIIKNYSAHDTRRVDLLIGIGYGSSIEKAIQVTRGCIQADQRILADPEPMIAVSDLADSSVNLVIRTWVNAGDYWGLKFDLTRTIKEKFDENGIEIPFPQRVVHHVNPAS